MQPLAFPAFPLVILVELLFGLGYNRLAAWLQKHSLMHVSYQVVAGVAGTLLIAGVGLAQETMPFWQAAALLLVCFGASGAPMIIGSNLRSVESKETHKARPWPTRALQARDDAIIDLTTLANEIAASAKARKLSIEDFPGYINRIYQVIGTLKSV